MLADLASTLVFELLLSSQKTYPKKSIENKFEKLVISIKDGQNKLSLLELQKILEAINLVDMTENSNIHWIGPDCVNITGVTYSVMKNTRNIEDVIVDHYRIYKQTFPLEISQRESSFFLSLYHTLCQESSKSGIDKYWFTPDKAYFQEHPKRDDFDQVGFAALKNKTVSYVINKPVTIIGCSKRIKGETISWGLDLDLYPDPYASKQHAVLMYNFQLEKFEIKCLSSTNPIKVKDKLLYEKDDPKILEENCFIRIGKQTLWFTIMLEEEPNDDDLEEK